MGTWWRSEEMTYVSLIVTEEAAQSCVRELGKLGCIQFSDLNPDLTPFQREYVNSIKRCDEIERKVRYVHGEIKRLGLTVSSEESLDDFIGLNRNEQQAAENGGSGAYILETIENKLSSVESQLKDLVEYNSRLSDQFNRKVEYHHLLIQAKKIGKTVSEIELKEAAVAQKAGEVMSPLINGDIDGGSSFQSMDEVDVLEQPQAELAMTFSNISGVIGRMERSRFERMLFRATRGNCYIRFSELNASDSSEGPLNQSTLGRNANKVVLDADGKPLNKICFVIFYKSAAIEGKIIKICEAFGATRYDLSMLNRSRDLEAVRQENYQELLDSKAVLDKNTQMRLSLCENLSGDIEGWLWTARREKSVYHTLNLFKADVAGRLMRARGWISNDSINTARRTIDNAHTLLSLPSNALLEIVSPGLSGSGWPEEGPPTHFSTNKYTYAFQEFVNTYGMPRYREINPALFTAATFPFLFGVMYGDIGHGAIVTIGALYLVLTESRMKNRRSMDEMLYNVYTARYMLLGMGCCAVYAGLIYNDFFSLGLDLFGTTYLYDKPGTELESGAKPVHMMNGKPAEYGDPSAVYPFGCDPVWKVSGNELLFFNSMKMKMSVILGIIQMTWGICLRGVNYWYAENGFGLSFWTEFAPMITFDVAFFGYMIVLIFVKWSINWDERMALGSCAYDVSGKFGGCHLDSSTTECYTQQGFSCNANTPLADMCPLDYGGSGDGCQPPNLITTLISIVLKPGAVEEPMFYGQAGLQIFLLLISFACVPWLLCVKPYVLLKRHQEEQKGGSQYMELGVSDSGHGASNPLINSNLYDRERSSSADSTSSDTGDISAELAAQLRESGYEVPTTTDSSEIEMSSLTNRKSNRSEGEEKQERSATNRSNNAAAATHTTAHGHDDEWNFGEICIHQAIETIEFVLGMVSNTASYLRLWALSLAHTELASVFWNKTMLGAIESGNPFLIFIAFGIFAACTGGVLLSMDVLECFLHALRLHWVEFQNKFYKADGYRFVPFDFKEILSSANLD